MKRALQLRKSTTSASSNDTMNVRQMVGIIPSMKSMQGNKFWLRNTLYYLKTADRDVIMDPTSWLNDQIMDAAQQILCKGMGIHTKVCCAVRSISNVLPASIFSYSSMVQITGCQLTAMQMVKCLYAIAWDVS